jgi:hypothetical protein
MNIVTDATHAALSFSLDAALRVAAHANEPTLIAPAAPKAAHVLRMTERQAQALAAVLVHVSDAGEGGELADLYDALVAGGAEVDEVWSGVEGGLVVVSREALQ